jgi:hypothetical protein
MFEDGGSTRYIAVISLIYLSSNIAIAGFNAVAPLLNVFLKKKMPKKYYN